MSGKRYTDESEVQVAKQLLEQSDRWATRLDVSIHSLSACVREQRKVPATGQADALLAAEIRRLQAEVRRLTEERDVPKKGRSLICQGVMAKYSAASASRLGMYSHQGAVLGQRVRHAARGQQLDGRDASSGCGADRG